MSITTSEVTHACRFVLRGSSRNECRYRFRLPLHAAERLSRTNHCRRGQIAGPNEAAAIDEEGWLAPEDRFIAVGGRFAGRHFFAWRTIERLVGAFLFLVLFLLFFRIEIDDDEVFQKRDQVTALILAKLCVGFSAFAGFTAMGQNRVIECRRMAIV